MAKTTAAEDYPLPATADAIRERIAELTGDCIMIWAQLGDVARRETMDEREYRAWKSKAQQAHAHKVREKTFLKAQLARLEHERQDAARARRAERIAQAELSEERKAAALAAAPDEAQLIKWLYAGLTRLYRVSGMEVTARDQATMEKAHAYLIGHGVFDGTI